MPSNERLFPAARYDGLAKAVTVVCCALLLAIALIPHMPWIVPVIDVLVVLVAYAYSPRGYIVADGSITVKRLVNNVVLPLGSLREARAVSPADLRGAMKLWGNGGMFGYYGVFRTSQFGRCTWYLTGKANAVVVVTGSKTFLFSPADVGGFLGAVGSPSTAPDISPTPAAGISAAAIARTVVLLAVAAILAFAFLYSPGPPSYTLTRDSLTIHDKFYSVTLKAADVHVSAIRIVDLSREPDWRPTARTNGFANAHYQSGWFRLANGQRVEMYRAGGDRLVLLPGKAAATTILYQAEDPEAFARQVRTAWSGQ